MLVILLFILLSCCYFNKRVDYDVYPASVLGWIRKLNFEVVVWNYVGLSRSLYTYYIVYYIQVYYMCRAYIVYFSKYIYDIHILSCLPTT